MQSVELILLVVTGLLLMGVLFLAVILARLLMKQQTENRAERTELLNRLMTKEWTSFAQVQTLSQSPFDFDDDVRGMSDDVELERIAQQPVGEVYYDYETDARELGLLDE